MTLAEYNQTCFEISRVVISRYSTSFSWGTMMFPREIRAAIASIYGFVRLADEVVDTFHEYDKAVILTALREEVDAALVRGISVNPLLQSFQLVAHQYNLERVHINAFLKSMEMDLTLKDFSRQQYDEYIYGSAEVIGLMCLKVFCTGQPGLFEDLAKPAQALGSAFQKVNFLRDIKSDLEMRGRIYLPGIKNRSQITNAAKRQIEAEIDAEFSEGLAGIQKLPRFTRVAVYSTYLYYQALFRKLRAADIEVLMSRRVRVNNFQKFLCSARAGFAVALRLV